MTIPVIIDTDPGIDDAVAICLALASPELDVIGLTTVGGNAGLAHTTRNALRLLHLLGRDDVPLAAGADRPLAVASPPADPVVHGANGFGGVDLPDPGRGPDPRGAVRLMADLVEASPFPVTLIAIGPLTNVALLAATHPATYARLGRVVIMGGGVRERLGNTTVAAEFNIGFDPEAAARVFDAGVEVTMVGLNVTYQARLGARSWAALRASGGPVAAALLPMIDYYRAFHLASTGSEATAQHDSMAVASVIRPELVRTQACWVGVELTGSLTRGMTVADLDTVTDRPGNARVALDVDAERFAELLLTRLVALDQAVVGSAADGR